MKKQAYILCVSALLISALIELYNPQGFWFWCVPTAIASLGYGLLQLVIQTRKLVFKKLYMPTVLLLSFAYLRSYPFEHWRVEFWLMLIQYVSIFVAASAAWVSRREYLRVGDDS